MQMDVCQEGIKHLFYTPAQSSGSQNNSFSMYITTPVILKEADHSLNIILQHLRGKFGNKNEEATRLTIKIIPVISSQ